MTRLSRRVLSTVSRFFQCDPDLRLTGSEVYLDPSAPRRTAIISHGHSDHIGGQDFLIATRPTAAFHRIREGSDLRGTEIGYRELVGIEGHEITLFPPGHILCSSMVRVRKEGETIVYTDDFRFGPTPAAEAAEVPLCDALIMESTYGAPEWKFPSRDLLCEQ